MRQAADRPEVVVITGASGGVGRAVAQQFGKHGASICLVARGEAGLEGAKRDVERLGGKAIIVSGDSADPKTHERAAQQAEEEFGPIAIWVNVAFTTVFSPFMEITPDEYKRVTEVTYLGYVYGTQAALRRMLPRNRGKIVQVGSALAYRGIPLQTAYCGAKHAIQGFTEALRAELIHNQRAVQLTMVQLPAVNTPQFTWGRNKMPRKAQPVPPIYQPELIAEAIYWAAHRKKRQLYIGGSTVAVIMGNKFFAKFGDWYLGKTGFNSQMRDEQRDPNQPDNLFEPVDTEVDYGAHGAFDQRSTDQSYTLWVTEHKGIVATALAGVAGAALAGSLFASGRSKG
jgi:short-subunit dehydrogenase